MTYLELLKEWENVPDAANLLREIAGWDLSGYLAYAENEASPEHVQAFLDGIRRLKAGEPFQYVTGIAYFYGRPFRVDPDVLIPRYDSECLLQAALSAARPGMALLDLCTGSGILGITLKLEEPGLSVTASDISKEALRIAKDNAAYLAAEIRFVESDLFTCLTEVYDVIVSNPPYVSEAEYETLEPVVRDHEPALALLGGPDGLSFYKRIAAEAPGHLKPAGLLLLEIGDTQAKDVAKILIRNNFTDIRVLKDLAGRDRVVAAKRL